LYRQAKEEQFLTYTIKTQLSPAAILPALRNAVQSIDKDLPLRDIRTQTEQIEANISQERLFATLTAGFGILACIGIYGIMAYNVARRTNEIGVRMALGARAPQVLFMILRGIVVGLAAAFGLTRFVRTMLYGLQPTDPATFIPAAVLLLLIAIAAGYGPACRASRIDPMQALRHE
jgi:ABC-type antimicrobial peptide transport system permease subunit